MLCAATSAGVCSAQQTNRPLSPSEIVDRFLKAQQAEQWSEAARYLDLDALKRIREREIENYSNVTRFPWTVEKLMKQDPDMPRPVAEYQIQRMDRLAKEFDIRKPWSSEFIDVDSLSELQKLTGEQLAVSWVKAHDLLYRARHNTAACEHFPRDTVAAPSSRTFPRRTYRILGEVVSDSVAYVLKENAFDGTAENALANVGVIFPPDNFILRKVAGTWKMLPFMGNASIVSIDCVVESPSSSPKK